MPKISGGDSMSGKEKNEIQPDEPKYDIPKCRFDEDGACGAKACYAGTKWCEKPYGESYLYWCELCALFRGGWLDKQRMQSKE